MNLLNANRRTQFLSFIARTESPLINDDESGRRASLPNNVLPENFLLRQKPILPPTIEDETRNRVFSCLFPKDHALFCQSEGLIKGSLRLVPVDTSSSIRNY